METIRSANLMDYGQVLIERCGFRFVETEEGKFKIYDTKNGNYELKLDSRHPYILVSKKGSSRYIIFLVEENQIRINNNKNTCIILKDDGSIEMQIKYDSDINPTVYGQYTVTISPKYYDFYGYHYNITTKYLPLQSGNEWYDVELINWKDHNSQTNDGSCCLGSGEHEIHVDEPNGFITATCRIWNKNYHRFWYLPLISKNNSDGVKEAPLDTLYRVVCGNIRLIHGCFNQEVRNSLDAQINMALEIIEPVLKDMIKVFLERNFNPNQNIVDGKIAGLIRTRVIDNFANGNIFGDTNASE